MNWAAIWNDIKNYFKTNVWNIVLFFAVLFLGIILVKLIINIIKRILNKTKMEKIAVGFIVGVIRLLLYLCLCLALLSIIGIEITGIITALSALFLSVGLALQDNIANVANGIIIVSSKMFKKGDYINVDGVEGSITQINFLYTTIVTPDNKRITIPNSKIVNNAVIDYDSNLTRRVNFTFNVAYSCDVEQVKKIVIDCMKSNGLVLLNPEPFCRLCAMKDSSLEFTARCWCDREDYWTVYYDIMEMVFNEFKRNNISIPYNQLEVRQRTDNPESPVLGQGLPERVEKKREENKHIDLEEVDLAKIFTTKRNKNPSKNKSKKVKKAEKVSENEGRATELKINENVAQTETQAQEKNNKKEEN